MEAFFIGKAMEQIIIMDKQDIDRTLKRMTHEIWERNRGADNLYLIGIRRRGVTIANRIARHLKEFEGVTIEVGVLDINLYRDDLSEVASQPIVKKTEIPFPVTGASILLCDDVLFTGRTIRAALAGIVDMGRPQVIRLLTLLDRGHRELPIQPNYVGNIVSTSRDESVEVMLEEDDGVDQVIITRGEIDGSES
jgi:pyrimidine operon attenuation protein/uracil phosphoribosyltransferase